MFKFFPVINSTVLERKQLVVRDDKRKAIQEQTHVECAAQRVCECKQHFSSQQLPKTKFSLHNFLLIRKKHINDHR